MRTLHFLKTLGAGSFGTVYLAELSSEQGFSRNVAVKVIQNSHPDNKMFISRIRDEARLLGLLQDDAILKVLDMVNIHGRDAVLMEFVEGVDIEDIVSYGAVPPARALAELGSAVAGALSRAHNARHPRNGAPLNVIHRDVKPANIMITRAGSVKLLDFGVARAKFESRESRTGHLVLGTLNYMAPEYIVSNTVSPALDIYGLGVSLWEIACGSPFGPPKLRQESHNRRLATHVSLLADKQPALADVLNRMLQWDERHRPTGAEAEQLLMTAADQIRGPSLRSWATSVIPQILQSRQSTPDSVNLVGQRVIIADMTKDAFQSPSIENESPLPAFSTERSDKSQDTVGQSRQDIPVTPKTTPSPTTPPPTNKNRSNPNRELILVVIKGLLVGGILGFLLIIAVGSYLLFFSSNIFP